MRQAWFALILVAGCSKGAGGDVKCGPGTKLVNNTCVADVAKQEPAAPTAKAAEGSAAVGAKPVDPTGPKEEWLFTSHRDDMRGKVVYFARLLNAVSPQEVMANNVPPPMAIQLRKPEPGAGIDSAAILQLATEMFECGYNGCMVAMKFDDGPVESWQLLPPQGLNPKVLFIERTDAFIKKVRAAKRLMVEVNLFQKGRQQVTFNLPSLDAWEAWKVDKTDAQKAQAINQSEAYCYDDDPEREERSRFCVWTAEECAKSIVTRDRLGIGSTSCKRFHPPPCKPPTMTSACNFKLSAKGANSSDDTQPEGQ